MSQTDAKNRFLVVDAFALLFRAHYAFATRPLLTEQGLNTSAVFGFMRSLLECMQAIQPTHLAVAYDSGHDTFRRKLAPQYKANRPPTPDSIVFGDAKSKEILQALGVQILCEPGYEADDLVGSLVQQFANHETTIYMFTHDKDYQQLLGPASIMVKPGRMGGDLQYVTAESLCKKYGIDQPEQFIDILALWGDASDNVPGVPGIGEKTAARLIAQYGALEWVLGNAAKLTPKIQKGLTECRDQLQLARKLVTIVRDAPVDTNLEAYIPQPRNDKMLQALFTELEFKSLGRDTLKYFDSAFSKDAASIGAMLDDPTSDHGPKSAETTAHHYHLIESDEQFYQLIDRLNGVHSFALDTETTGFSPHTDRIVGISFSVTPHEAFFLPVPPPDERSPERMQALQRLLARTDLRIVGHNIKFDLLMLRGMHLEVAGELCDTMILHYLLHPDSPHNLDEVALKLLNYRPIHFSHIMGGVPEKQFDITKVPLDQLCEYASEDADVTWQLASPLLDQLDHQGLSTLYWQIEAPLIRVLVDMEWAGVRMDADRLESLRSELTSEMRDLEVSVRSIAKSTDFNIDSPKQIGELLFDTLKIADKPKRTRTGQYNTSVIELQKYAHQAPVVHDILDYREVKKLLSTYVDALPELVESATGRIHANFNQAVAATGRLSSSNPNLQNIPVRDARGKRIREAFISRFDGGLLLSADYSQIELRLLAHVCQDEHMLAAFRAGHDIHASTAAKIFGIPQAEVSKPQREMAKRVNFGIVYGISPYGLSQQLSIAVGEAARFMEDYFSVFPGVKRYMDSTIAQARAAGYTKTLWGRRRHLPDLHAEAAQARAAAERTAINTPIQGSAADIIKRAMVDVAREMNAANMQSVLIIQVHDELLFDVAPGELSPLSELVTRCMEGAAKLDVPLVVDLASGTSWGALE